MIETVVWALLSAPAGAGGYGLGVLWRRFRGSGRHGCGEPVREVCARLGRAQRVPGPRQGGAHELVGAPHHAVVR